MSEGNDTMAPDIYLITIGLFFGTILTVFAMRHLAQFLAARARAADEAAYRRLAERSLAAQEAAGAALAEMRTDLARLAASLGAVETILKQVE